ncbi:MAG: hypothetical protein NTV49_02735 [Kiritimatiellaeota bacterium]|nr:hypothetical protein [Kiritimatiellota bacterium]
MNRPGSWAAWAARSALSPATPFTTFTFGGAFHIHTFDGRLTPFHKAHSTAVAGLHNNPNGDDRYYNHVFLKRSDLTAYDSARLPVWMSGNVYLNGAKPSQHETAPLVKPEFDPAFKLVEQADGCFLEFTLGPGWAGECTRKLVTTALLGKASIPDLPYEQRDGAPLRIVTDYFGKSRNEATPTPGPFEKPGTGAIARKVWS